MLMMNTAFIPPHSSRWQIRTAKPRFWIALVWLTLLFAFKNEALAQTTINVPKDQPTIQAGINAAANGDTVLVAPGTYKENIDFKGNAITLLSSGGAASTTIDGGGHGPVVLFANGETRNSVINGFTIRNGGPTTNGVRGGGISIMNAGPTILNNVVTNNMCSAISTRFGTALIEGNVLSQTLQSNCENSGLYIANSPTNAHSIVIGNIIEQNVYGDASGSGGIQLYETAGEVIENNVIRNNATAGRGGGIASFDTSSLVIVQNLIYGNSSQLGGGGVDIASVPQNPDAFYGFIANNTIVGNSTAATESAASQVYLEGDFPLYAFANNIVIGNSPLTAFACAAADNATPVTPTVLDHNDLYNPSGPAVSGFCDTASGAYGNISADPQFANAANNDYHLMPASPAIDVGNNSALQLLAEADLPLTKDLDGTAREQDAAGKGYPVIDMGAYEHPGNLETGTTSIVLNPSQYDLPSGIPVTLSAKLVSPNGAPSGSVTFFRNLQQIGTAAIDGSGTATLPALSLAPGVYAFVAAYSGTGSFTPATSVKIYVIVEQAAPTTTSTSLSSSLNPAPYGQPVTFTATVSSTGGTPTGTVVFSDGTTTLATLTLANGVAAYITSTLAVGIHTITASFEGSGGFANSSGSVVETIAGLTSATSLTVTPNPAYVLASTTLAAKVTGQGGTPGGTVTFSANGSSIGTATVNAAGIATLTYAFQNVGTETVTAAYGGDASYSGSTSSPVSVNVLINPTATTVSATPNPALAFQSTMLIARVASTNAASLSATPGGTVSFYDGAASLGTATLNVDGSAAISSVSFQAGTHSITAVYSGSADFAPSTAAAYSLVVNPDPTVTVLSSAPNPAQFGSPVLFNAAVSAIAIPTGTVTFFDAGTAIGSAAVDGNGNASFVTSSLAVGTHAITASYAGSANFGASMTGVVNEVILAYAGNFSITVTPGSASVYTGASAAFTVAVAPTGGWNGNVTLSCSQLPANATCAFGTTSIAAGNGTTSLTIQTAAPQHAAVDSSGRFPWVRGAGVGLAMAFLIVPFRLRRSRFLLAALLMVGMGGIITGCGAGPVTGGTPPGVYSVSVNATYSANGQALVVQSAVVKLTVKTLF